MYFKILQNEENCLVGKNGKSDESIKLILRAFMYHGLEIKRRSPTLSNNALMIMNN